MKRIIAAIIVLALLLSGCGQSAAAPEENTASVGNTAQNAISPAEGYIMDTVKEDEIQAEAEENAACAELPFMTADGRLSVEAIFASDIINPDSGEAGNDIISIEVTNLSENFLLNAEFEIIFTNGSSDTVMINDLPGGKTVWAFSESNMKLPACAVSEINCAAEFSDQDVFAPQLRWAVSDTDITVSNFGAESLENVEIACRCVVDDVYFGGKSFVYTIDEINTGTSVHTEAVDVFFGELEIVRIMQK